MAKHREEQKVYMSQPHIRHMGTGLELYGRKKNGSEFPVDIALGPMQMNSDTVTLAVVRDFTERKRAEDKIKKLNDDLFARNEKLESVNQELESFIYSVSHDLRAPLRHISGFADLMEKDIADKLDEKGKQHFSRIHEGIHKMSSLIDDLLKLSKISTQEIHRRELNLSEIVASIVAVLREAHPGRSIEIDIKEGLTSLADRGLIEIVFSNLLGNAWKFTAKTEKARIEFGTVEQDGEFIYYVRDNGAGFDQKYAGRMFWPFQRLHSNEEFEGSGVGLAIVDRIIRSHGGKVWAEGTLGKGATIYFSLA
jgi:light-regulated signal transduction histidine kinase (bacteriophytochrome)